MRYRALLLAACVAVTATELVLAQKYDPPPVQEPDAATLKAIEARRTSLGNAVTSLRVRGMRDPWLAEVEVYHKAATWIVRHDEFYQADAGKWTLDVLDRGLLRAAQLAQGDSPWLNETGHPVVRAYRSRIDSSVQPYAVTFPPTYGKDPRKKWRIDVVLHGRDSSLTEVKFLHQHAGDREPSDKEKTGAHFVQIDIYGRGNNAYRWAGETDVFEVLDNFFAEERLLRREALLDPDRVVLHGFSMGGAGTWHLGLHRPDRWCVIGPGAGFTTTHGYVPGLPEQLPPYQEDCLTIYDAVDYAENASDVPVVAYDGADDAQLQAARNIEARLKPLGIPMELLVAPGLAHQFPPEWQKKAEQAYAPFVARGRNDSPAKVKFVTYTLKYPSCAWVEIIRLDRHYHQAVVDAERTDEGFTVKTQSVRALRLAVSEAAPSPVLVRIDGQTVSARPSTGQNGALSVYLERRSASAASAKGKAGGGPWAAVLPQKLIVRNLRRLQKANGLQGPIDDAFMGSFLCVRGTGKPWHEATRKYAEQNLKRFEQEWNKYFRGEIDVKDDVDVNDEDIAANHLILFGDPASNALIAQVLDGLPLTWTKEAIALGGRTYSGADHVPILIYPSPLNSARYVVLNSGHTFHAADFRGTNALLFPRLGDYAVLKLAPKENDPLAVEVAAAGIFDDSWRLETKGE